MGVEVLVIAIIAGVISLISGATSIATCAHVKRTLILISDDKTSVDIFNKATDEETSDGRKIHTREQKIHIEDIDTDFASGQFSGTRTGLPNKTAEILGKGGTGALSGLITPSKSTIPSILLEQEEHEEKGGYDSSTISDTSIIELSEPVHDYQLNLSGTEGNLDSSE